MPQARHPELLASRWRKKGAAYITDPPTKPVRYSISTAVASDELSSTIEVSKSAEDQADEKTFYMAGYSYPWLLHMYEGNIPDLERMGHGVVNLAGSPSPEWSDQRGESSRYQRPRRDLLFEGGDLELTVITGLSAELSGQRFNLGRVIGLTIVTETSHVPVWTPDSQV